MTEFKMPSLGADMVEGTLVQWLVKPGDRVHKGDIVAVVETDKGAIDVEIFEDGVVEDLLVEPTTTLPVGAAMATIRSDDEASASTAQARQADDSRPRDPQPETVAEPPAAAMSPPSPAAPSDARKPAAPRARQRARELGLALEDVAGTGPGGAITFDDVERTATRRDTSGPRRMRAAIAAAMTRSNREIPHYYLGHTIDLERASLWLEHANENRPISDRILMIALLVRATARALREFPGLCGWWRDGSFVASADIDVGLAVALRGDAGLVNPALPAADRGSLTELMARIADVSKRARSGQLRSSEMTGGALTITSLGERGVETVFGVIHPPQVALVGFGTVASRPVVIDGAVRPRPTVEVTLAGDHRASDGHLGARFLRKIDTLLQDPEAL